MAYAALEYGEGNPDTAMYGRLHGEGFSSQVSPEGRFHAFEWVKSTCGTRADAGF